ncbi:MAG: Smr/MutS family protein [Thermodesulfobacteriota bacterium]
MKPVKVPITDILDLHAFNPRELPDLLDDYLTACTEAEIYSVRLIHGKGMGILRERVLGILKQHPLVQSHKPAPPDAGGWGAVLVELKRL